MSESQQDDRGPLQEENELTKAHKLANTITLNRFTSKLNRDPAADLSQLLPQQAVAYPRLRDSLAQAAQRRAAISNSDEKPSSNTSDSPSSDVDSPQFLIDDVYEIVHPLGEKLVALASLSESSPEAPSRAVNAGVVTGLNQAIRDGQVLWALHGTFVVSIGTSVVVKIGSSLDPDGITNLQYINTQAPQVPTPLCLGSLISDQTTYFFMSRAEGVTLETIWPQLSIAHKSSITQQLNCILGALRAEVPDSRRDGEGQLRIGSFTSGTCKDMRRWQRVSEGPVHSEAEFNDFLCSDPRRSITPWIKMIRSSMREDHCMVMTHGDLHPRNIMVERGTDEEGGERIRVTSLIDWELGGWYPEYWEFVKALSTIDARGPLADWFEYLPTEAIGKWPVEYSIDSLISRWLG